MSFNREDREAAYAGLVADRKSCRKCLGLENPSRFCDGKFDSDHLGPWTLWQGNIQSKLLVVGQDWGDTAYFERNRGRDLASNPTNKVLRDLLSIAGIRAELPSATDSGAGEVFLTNAILCLKEGGLQAKVDPSWFVNCGDAFLRPTIELINPRVVVTLGQHAYKTICQVFRLPQLRFREAVDADPIELKPGCRLAPVYHCGVRILNTHRPLSKQQRDWVRVRRAMEE